MNKKGKTTMMKKYSKEYLFEQLKKVRIIRGKRIDKYELTGSGLPDSKTLRKKFKKQSMEEVWELAESDLSPGIKSYLGIGEMPRFSR